MPETILVVDAERPVDAVQEEIRAAAAAVIEASAP